MTLELLKVALLFALTAVAEIVGCYLPWLVIKQGKSIWLLIPAMLSLALFAWLLTLHPSAAGRTYAAYGGMYIASLCGWGGADTLGCRGRARRIDRHGDHCAAADDAWLSVAASHAVAAGAAYAVFARHAAAGIDGASASDVRKTLLKSSPRRRPGSRLSILTGANQYRTGLR